MDSKVIFITKVVKAHDRELFAKRVRDRIIVYRHSTKAVPYQFGNVTLVSLESSPKFVLGLTHNWQFNGTPRDWGWEPIRQRLADMDMWANEKFLAEMEAEEEAREKSKKRDVKNNMESFMSDQYSTIKKSWSDINTSSLTKK